MPIHVPGQLRKTAAEKHYAPIIPRLLELLEQGYNQPAIAEILNREGFTTLKGFPLHQVAIHRLLKRAEKQARISTPSGAALAKQANIEARQPTLDERMADVARRDRAKLDQGIEIMKSHPPDPRQEQPVPPPAPPDIPPGERKFWMT